MNDRIPTIPVTIQYFQHRREVWVFALPRAGDKVMCFFPQTLGDELPLFLVVETVFHTQLRARYENSFEPEPLGITVSTRLDPHQQQANEAALKAEGGNRA